MTTTANPAITGAYCHACQDTRNALLDAGLNEAETEKELRSPGYGHTRNCENYRTAQDAPKTCPCPCYQRELELRQIWANYCDDCTLIVYDSLGEGYTLEQCHMLLGEMGAELPDHECVKRSEPELETTCLCACNKPRT